MGRKPGRQGQYFYFCVALLIFVSGCSLTQEANQRREMREALNTADTLFEQGDFTESLNAFQKISEAAQDKPPADRATYSIGLVYAHPQNPQRDLQQAKIFMDRVVRMYPDSPWAEQAQIWVGVLDEDQKSKREIEKVRLELEASKEEAEKSRLVLDKMKQEMDKSRLELEKTKQEMEKNKQVIEKSKKVDIEIDRKRRDRGR
jgi:outer membrane protein assembly factor BamD (BamD/ComL family)